MPQSNNKPIKRAIFELRHPYFIPYFLYVKTTFPNNNHLIISKIKTNKKLQHVLMILHNKIDKTLPVRNIQFLFQPVSGRLYPPYT